MQNLPSLTIKLLQRTLFWKKYKLSALRHYFYDHWRSSILFSPSHLLGAAFGRLKLQITRSRSQVRLPILDEEYLSSECCRVWLHGAGMNLEYLNNNVTQTLWTSCIVFVNQSLLCIKYLQPPCCLNNRSSSIEQRQHWNKSVFVVSSDHLAQRSAASELVDTSRVEKLIT